MLASISTARRVQPDESSLASARGGPCAACRGPERPVDPGRPADPAARPGPPLAAALESSRPAGFAIVPRPGPRAAPQAGTMPSAAMISKAVRAALLLLALLAAAARACTEVVIKVPTGETVVANSLEAGDVEVELRVGQTQRGSAHGGHAKGCMSFEAKFGFVHGMNEAGLCLNEHALDLAVMQQPIAGTPTLCKVDFESWALGMHSTVAEVAAELKGLRVVGGDGGQWGIHDAAGHSIVVEFVKGELRLHNNTQVGVMTNDPTWDWHLQNVNNYVALQPGWYGTQNKAAEVSVADDPWYPWAHNACKC